MHYFLSALGTAKYNEVNYKLDGEPHRSRFAPAAVAALAHLENSTGLILLTEEAREKNWPELQRELQDLKINCIPITVRERLGRDDVFVLVDILTREIPPTASVVLDITLGLRHLPVIYYAALVFAAGLKGASVERIYYAPFELHQGDTVEVFDLTLTFRLLEWFHGVKSFHDSGDGRPLSRLLDSDVSQLFRTGQRDPNLGRARDAMRRLSVDLASGLPLQAGLAAGRLNAAFHALAQSGTSETLSRLGAQLIDSATAAIAADATNSNGLALNTIELTRQLRLAEWYAKRDDLGKCFAILREWMVNARLFAAGDTAHWLSPSARRPAERFFTTLRERGSAGLLTETQQKASALWDRISERRNFLQHCGMNDKVAVPTAEQAAQCLEEAQALMEREFDGLVSSPGSGRLLLSPLGNSPGTIYTAIKRLKPDKLIVISSKDAAARLPEALQQAGWNGPAPLVRIVQDAFTGFNEAHDLMDREVIDALSGSAEILANLTGATTAMQWVVENMARRAERLSFRLCRVALIDRRAPAQQQLAPYVEGEVIYLDQGSVPTTID